MLKQVEIHGQAFELYSPDGGRTWSSSPQALVAFRRRQEKARATLRKRIAMIEEEIPDPDPDCLFEIDLPRSAI
ncbi:MAG: hypothetical protein HY695_20275 [Deltaproteobacteria bacterium]|nr:hypothetical protein [Deltaproteobacteria bacterium]